MAEVLEVGARSVAKVASTVVARVVALWLLVQPVATVPPIPVAVAAVAKPDVPMAARAVQALSSFVS